MEIVVPAPIKDDSIQREEPQATTADPAAAQAEEARDEPFKFKVVARAARQPHGRNRLTPDELSTVGHPAVKRVLLSWAKKLSTVAIALVAVLISIVAWDHYLATPWTRDGRVRVQVASVAPQISGQIKELRIADNQFVHKGDVLYVIDPFDFNVT